MPRKKLDLVGELKRRKVGKAFLAWAGSAVFVKEGVEILGPVVGLGDAGVRIVFFLVLLSFPAFVFFAWTFEFTDGGLEVTDEVDEEASPDERAARLAEARSSSGGLSVGLIFVVLALGTFYLLDPGGLVSRARIPLQRALFTGVTAESVSGPIVEGGIEVDADLTLRLTGSVDPTTASSESVRLLDAGGEVIPATVSVDFEGSEVVIDPRSPLGYGREYAVEVSPMLRGVDGQPVWDAEKSGPGARLTFRTQPVPADGVHPRARLGAGVDGEAIPAEGPVTLAFDEPIDPGTAEGAVRLVAQDGAAVETTISITPDNRELRIEPAAPLRAGGRYTVTVDSTLTAATGVPALAVELPVRVEAPRSTPTATRQAAATQPAPSRSATGPASLSLNVADARALPHLKAVVDGDTLPLPITGLSLAEGRSHRIRIVGIPDLSAYTIPVFDRTVTPGPGERLDLNVEITPFGSVDIVSSPVGIAFIDGREIGRTPIAGYPVAANVIHELEIRPLPGDAGAYDPFTGPIRVQPLEWRSLGRLELPPKGGAAEPRR